MKMPRSRCEDENVQFVQELAEVDGPFESPININFRDLTKLELPSLVWNRSETCPKKMKITNTGHTVIISGKWKCERPYLTGGPLIGKYVFSQIHFHWGQDDCKGSEHQVCGESFPLEMHVVHFKTEYLTQESALKEKDGMVVIVYLFKLQEEPNASIKKILNLLPNVKQASTSHTMNARPIMSLCNTFSDDYFMYWGSVVTSTCAHILLWIICREPFGISRDQVNEFRKILDISQQPICRNSREPQPIHKRNVFHVNASKNICDPMLPIKNMMGCCCEKSEENINFKSQTNDCSCQAYLRNQEEIEGNNAEYQSGYLYNKDSNFKECRARLPRNVFIHHSVVKTDRVSTIPIFPRRFKSIDIGHMFYLKSKLKEKLEANIEEKFISRSCYCFSVNDFKKSKGRGENSKLIRYNKKPYSSIKPFSQIMNSLETLKSHTLKKLKEIETINREIKKMKPVSHKSEDKKWLDRFEKIMRKQKRSAIRTSEGYFSELKNIAKECNKFDKIFGTKVLTTDVNNQKTLDINQKIPMERALPCSDVCLDRMQEILAEKKTKPQTLLLSKKFESSYKMQKLIQSFFEDIRETEDISKDSYIEKIKNLSETESKKVSTSTENLCENHITKKNFKLGDLNCFFTEIITENINIKDNEWNEKSSPNPLIDYSENNSAKDINDKNYKIQNDIKEKKSEIPDVNFHKVIPLHKANIALELPKTFEIKQDESQNETKSKNCYLSEEYRISVQNFKKNSASPSCKEVIPMERNYEKRFKETTTVKPTFLNKVHNSSSNVSGYSIETPKMIIAKLHTTQFKKNFKEKKMPLVFKIPSEELYRAGYIKHKIGNLNLEKYYIKKKKLKTKKDIKRRRENVKKISSFGDTSSTFKNNNRKQSSKTKWKYMTKTKFKIEMEKTSDSTTESAIECVLISPERKKIKLERKRGRSLKGKVIYSDSNHSLYTDSDDKLSEITKKCFSINNKKKTNIQIIRNKNSYSKEYNKTNYKNKKNPLIKATEKQWKKKCVIRKRANQNRLPSRESIKTNSLSSFSWERETQKTGNIYLPEKVKTEPKKTEEALTETKSENKNLSDFKVIPSEHSLDTNSAILPQKKNISSQQMEENAKILFINNQANRNLTKNFMSDGETRKKESYIFQTKSRYETEVNKFREYNVRFLTAASSQIYRKDMTSTTQCEEENNEHSTQSFNADEKNMTLSCQTGTLKLKTDYVNEIETSTKLDTHKNFTNEEPTMKGDVAPSTVDTKELHTSISYSSVLKYSPSRPHSTESLNPLKVSKRKGRKKRPYCCKRNSKHYIRKNYNVFKRLKKAESKPVNSFKLSGEEQLKIIFLNVANYLKRELIEKKHFDPKKMFSFTEIEQIILKDMKTSEESKNKILITKKEPILESQKIPPVDKTETQEKLILPEIATKETLLEDQHVEKNEDTNFFQKTEDKNQDFDKEKKFKLKEFKQVQPETSIKNTRIPCLLKPKNNFIKRNKLMAGKYKRQIPGGEYNADNKPNKNDESNESIKNKIEENIPESKQLCQLKVFPDNKAITDSKQLEKIKNLKLSKENGLKFSTDHKNANLDKKSTLEKSETTEIKKTSDDNEKCAKQTPSSSLILKKNPSTKKRWVPAYMLTSYSSTSIEIVDNQQQEMNKYLFNMKGAHIGNYLPNVMYGSKSQQKNGHEKKSDPLLTNDLEYLIRLQMYLNNEISENTENSRKYMKTLLGQDMNGTSIMENPCANQNLDIREPNSKGVVLIEMKDFLENSTSSSDFGDNSGKQIFNKESTKSIITNSIINFEKLKESGDPGTINHSVISEIENPIDCNSDSSYNCEISITLNTGSNEGESGVQIYDSETFNEEILNKYIHDVARSSSQTTMQLDSCSSSQSVVKLNRKKRKENEISIEMKQKLLEILEREIRKEMEISYIGSSETSSDTATQKWDEPKPNCRQ